MVQGVGKGGGLAREAILAALKSQAQKTSQVEATAQEITGSEKPNSEKVGFAQSLEAGLRSVDADIRTAENLPVDMVTGKVEDFHEVAVQLKKAEFSFRFAMEIRNKLIDAYREVMRMNV